MDASQDIEDTVWTLLLPVARSRAKSWDVAHPGSSSWDKFLWGPGPCESEDAKWTSPGRERVVG